MQRDAKNKPLEDDEAADLRLHAAYRQSQKLFFDLLAEASATKELHILQALRQQPVYFIAEFFYLLRAFGIATREQLRDYVELHNQQMNDLLADKNRLRLFGFTPSRLNKAMLDRSTANKLVVNYLNFDRGFDQADLGRLLVELMSPETCRKAVTKLEQAGLLERSEGVYNAIIVRSTGRLEDIFSSHLRAFRHSFSGRGPEYLPPD